MKEFFRKIIQYIYKISIISGFAKPIPKPEIIMLEETISLYISEPEILSAPVQYLEERAPYEAIEIQETAVVAEIAKPDEFAVPIRAIETGAQIPAPEQASAVREPAKNRKPVRRIRPAKSIDGIKKTGKSKPRTKKKHEPIPPEATGFGFQKFDNVEMQ